MLRPENRPARRFRAGLTLPELLVAIASFGVLGCLLFTHQVLNSTSEAPVISRVIVTPAPPAPPPARCISQGDVSLQETLDRLGYTVNVPHEFHGATVAADGYRVSTADDSVAA